SNNSTVTLTGDNNTSTVSQNGSTNAATINTAGNGNIASQEQTSDLNVATISQVGGGSTGLTTDNNEAYQIQKGGNSNNASIVQEEKGNQYAKQTQVGNDNQATINQRNPWGNLRPAPANPNYSNIHKQVR